MTLQEPMVAAEGQFRPVPNVIEAITGRRPSPATCYRMINKGGLGGKLTAQFILGRWCCRPSDFLDYAARQSAATLKARAAISTESAAQSADESQLRAVGLL